MINFSWQNNKLFLTGMKYDFIILFFISDFSNATSEIRNLPIVSIIKA